MSENEMILAGGADLVKQSELYEPMLYYGSKARITVDYVSDIHLLHHAPYFNYDIQKTIRAIAKSLYESMSFGRWGGTTVQAFLGDISSDGRVTVAFYKQYRMQDMYRQYKRFKRSLRSESDIQQLERRHIEIEKRYDRLSRFIDSKEVMIRALKSEIDEYVSYSKVIAPKGRLEDIKKYLASNYYKKREVPDAVTEKILLVSAVQDKVSDLQRKLLRLEQGINAEYDYDIVRLADFHYEQPSILGVVILGNHEYIGFYDVDDAVKFYKKELEPLGYRVLQNESLENDQVVIYAGSGFAKYSEQFNANNIVCCDAIWEIVITRLLRLRCLNKSMKPHVSMQRIRESVLSVLHTIRWKAVFQSSTRTQSIFPATHIETSATRQRTGCCMLIIRWVITRMADLMALFVSSAQRQTLQGIRTLILKTVINKRRRMRIFSFMTTSVSRLEKASSFGSVARQASCM